MFVVYISKYVYGLKKHERTFSRSLFFSLDTDPYLSNPYLLQFHVVTLKTQYGYKNK